MGNIKFEHIRNATSKITYKGITFLIDPMPAPKDAYPGFEGTYNNHLRFPLVDLPNSIMEILKDASATAIYGAQGANGVVLITTRRGKAGEAKFTYDGMVAMNRQGKRLDIMDLREFADYYNDFVNTGQMNVKEADKHFADPSLLGKGTNWQDAIFRTALQHSHQISGRF